jgi:hypothetical protein
LNPVRTSVHEDDNGTYASYIGSNKPLLYVTLSWYAARLGGCKLEGNSESMRYLQIAVDTVNKELENAHMNGIPDGTIAAVSSMANMEVRRITSLGLPN